MYLQDLSNILHEKSTKMVQLNKELTAKKAEIDKTLSLRMEDSRKDKELREKLAYLQSETSQSEQELRKLTSRVYLTS